ncbi:MAG: hypothetical protein QM503_12220 [Bacteroidota bacterium]
MIVIATGSLWKDESLDLGKDCIIEAHIQFYEDEPSRPISNTFIYATGKRDICIRFDLLDQDVYETSFGEEPTRARVTLKLRLLKGSMNGLSWFNAIWLAHNSMHKTRPYTDKGKQNTAIHEIGHFVDMVDPVQTTWYKEHGHQGGHCSTGLSVTDKELDSYSGLGGTCVMFGEGKSRATTLIKFCETCDPFIRKSEVRIKSNIPSDW